MARAFAVVSAWSSAGILTILQDGQMHAYSLLPADERALRQTGPLLERIGLLVCHGDNIALSRLGLELMSSGALETSFQEVKELASLDTALLTGAPVRETDGGVVLSEPDRANEFLRALHQRSRTLFDWTAQQVCDSLTEDAHILDLGGGHGGYAAAIVSAGAKKHVRATVFDRDVCVTFAQSLYGNVLEYRAGNFDDDDLSGPYDLVLMANVLHGMAPTRAARLIARVRGVLKVGGQLAILDVLRARNHSDQTALLDLTMFMTSRGGKSYQVDECVQFLNDGGFTVVRTIALPNTDYFLVVSM